MRVHVCVFACRTIRGQRGGTRCWPVLKDLNYFTLFALCFEIDVLVLLRRHVLRI